MDAGGQRTDGLGCLPDEPARCGHGALVLGERRRPGQIADAPLAKRRGIVDDEPISNEMSDAGKAGYELGGRRGDGWHRGGSPAVEPAHGNPLTEATPMESVRSRA